MYFDKEVICIQIKRGHLLTPPNTSNNKLKAALFGLDLNNNNENLKILTLHFTQIQCLKPKRNRKLLFTKIIELNYSYNKGYWIFLSGDIWFMSICDPLF